MNNFTYAELVNNIPALSEEERFRLDAEARAMQRASEYNPRAYLSHREYQDRGRRGRSPLYSDDIERIIRTLLDRIEILETEVINLKERADTVDFYRE